METNIQYSRQRDRSNTTRLSGASKIGALVQDLEYEKYQVDLLSIFKSDFDL